MASGGVGQVRDRGALLCALVLVHRYSVEITRIAATTLGSGRTDNRDVQLLVLIHGEPGVTAGRLRTMTGMARTAVSRSLAHLDAEGLVVRSVSPVDARSQLLRVTRKGAGRVARFERALEDYFASGAPLAKETLSVLHVSPAPGAQPSTALARVVALGGAGAAYVDEVGPVLSEFGIEERAERYAIALLLDRGQMRPMHLAYELGLSTSGVTDLLDRLVDAGIVHRGHDELADRRAVVVRLTDLGKRAATAELAVFARHADDICTALALTLPHP